MLGAKRSDVVARVADALTNDTVRFSDHARRRMDERLYEFGLDEIDVVRILKRGRREEEKDEWDAARNEWNYAFRGKTVDGAQLRVSLALKASGVLVITVVNLDLG